MDEPMASRIRTILEFFSFIPLFLQVVSRYMSIVRHARMHGRYSLVYGLLIMGAPWQG